MKPSRPLSRPGPLGRGAVGVAVFLLAGSGWAQSTQSQGTQGQGTQSQGTQGQGRVVTISEVTIVGRVQKPIAAVDVSRIQPRLTLAELDQPFANRIEKALYRAPF